MPVLADTLRMRLLKYSAIKIFPDVSTTTPVGWKTAAVAAITSFWKGDFIPLPATVVMMPVLADTFRMRLLPVSAIKTFPDLSTATSSGKFSGAVVAPTLSVSNPTSPVPASVVMMPLIADTFRIL